MPRLVDEVRLAIAPVVVGRGRRLFPDGSTPVGPRLLRPVLGKPSARQPV
ncbi:dihydrofolate reductase family protein [Streptomyces sp. NBC_01335]|nr:dihydrofolate reductase family protein [Streptomyces sp. NBC_01335]